MKINQIDVGGQHPYPSPVTGQVVASLAVEGSEVVAYGRGSLERKMTVSFFVNAWQSFGGQQANTKPALQYLLKQLEELTANSREGVYIQWTSTDQPGAAVNAFELHDGWYIVDDLQPDYHGLDFVVPTAQCRMTVTAIAAAPPRRVALAYAGGALASNFSGAAINALALPVGATALEPALTRQTAEGPISCIFAPVASPEPFVLPVAIAQIFQGGVHVYDTIS